MSDYKFECVYRCKAQNGECPTWSVEDQCLYWVDIDGQTFNRFDPATGQNRAWELPGHAGSFVMREGGGFVLAMADGFYELDLATGAVGKLMDVPYDTATLRFNDGRTDRQGRFWVGSMPKSFDDFGKITGTFYSYDGVRTRPFMTSVVIANGTAFSPDGRTMYRAESTLRTILASDFDPASGVPTNERVFATVPDTLGLPDGATVDSEGAYWVALPLGPKGGSVARFTADGKLDFAIDFPVQCPLMPAFGGPDMKTLYVPTGQIEPWLGRPTSELSGALFAVETDFTGIPETKFKPAHRG